MLTLYAINKQHKNIWLAARVLRNTPIGIVLMSVLGLNTWLRCSQCIHIQYESRIPG